MSRPVELALEAELENLREVQAAVERFSEEEALSTKAAYALSLCLEELLTNVVMYARKETGEKTQFRVVIAAEGELVQVEIEDDGPPYDPTETPEPDLDALLDDRPIGGLGVHLVRELSSRFAYSYADGRNRVEIALPRRAGAES